MSEPPPTLRRYVLRHPRALGLAVLFSVLVAALHTATFGALVPFFGVLFGEGGRGVADGLPDALRSRLEPLVAWAAADRSRALVALAALLVLLTALKGIARFFQEVFSGFVAHRATADIGNDLIARVLRIDYPTFLATGTAPFLSRFTVDLESVRVGLRAISGKAVLEPLRALGILVVLFGIDVPLALVSITAFPLVGLTFAAVGRRVKRGLLRILEKRQGLVGLLGEALRGLRVVKSFAAEPLVERSLRGANEGLLSEHMRLVRADALLSPLMEVFGAAAIGACVVVGGRSVISGALPPEKFLTFYMALVSLYEPIRKLSDAAIRGRALRAAADRLFDALRAPVEPASAPGAAAFGARGLERDLVFDRVSFSYDRAEIPALRKVSFAVGRGETLAIVGRSGAGKSTLMSLVPRFLEPTSGEIRVDGRDLRDFDLRSLRRGIGLVGQEIVLFQGTIRSNVAFGKGGEASEAEVRRAAELAQAIGFVDRLPRGLDTVVAEGGLSLSRGERQRIALARAILADPPLLLLDEVTSSLDAESEAAVQAALERFARDRTVIVIAHRLRTVERADRIVVLDRGEVAATGSHETLLRGCPLYRTLHGSGFGSPDPTPATGSAAGTARAAR